MSDTGYKGPLFSSNGVLGQAASRADQGKRIVHTIDPDFITGIGRVSAFGAKKYHQRNFLMAPGMEWGRVYDSLIGHLQAFWGGEEVDAESGELHILHAAWNLMVLHQYSTHPVYAPGDDRPSMIEHAGKSWKEWQEAFFVAQGTSPAKTDISANVTSDVPFRGSAVSMELCYDQYRGKTVAVYATMKGYPAKFNLSGVDSLRRAIEEGRAYICEIPEDQPTEGIRIEGFLSTIQELKYYYVGTARIPTKEEENK